MSGCAPPLPFSLVQSLIPENPRAGAFSPFTFALSRADGQQYLSRVTTTLPPGLVGAIPSVPLCSDAAAERGHLPGREPDRHAPRWLPARAANRTRSPARST